MAAADEFDGFLVDLDGVVWEGRELVPGSVEALRTLIESGKELVFVTNNSVKQPAAYAARLREAGVDVAGDAGRDRGRGDRPAGRRAGGRRRDRLRDRGARLQARRSPPPG